MDGAKVPSALIGVSRPADPGQHTVRASGNGVESDPQTVSLQEGSATSITLALKPIAGTMPALVPGPSQPLATPGPSTGAVDTGGALEPKGNGLRTASYVALGVGVVGLAAGTVFGLQAKSKYSDGNDVCKNQDPCTLSPAGASRREQLGKDGDRDKTLSIIGFVAGGVGVAAGTTLFLLSHKKESEPAHAELRPWIGLGALGLSGRF
jgi:hypothetical protein